MHNRSKKIIILLSACVMVVLVSLIAVLALSLSNDTNHSLPQDDPSAAQDKDEQNSQNKPAPDFSAFSILSTEEKGDSILVETSFSDFRYPGAFADTISVKAQGRDTSAILAFFAKIGSEEVPLFTVHYGGQEGIPCGTLTLSEDVKTVAVSVTFADLPADLSSDDQITFWAAQELFNDVITSMEEDPRFSGD